MDTIAVLIPCYNESRTIEKVVADWNQALPEAVIYVYDNNSTDSTDELARQAAARVEVPIGCVIVDPANDTIIAEAYNLSQHIEDATAHAEIKAIQEACRQTGSNRLRGLDMYVTLEPCTMCAAAISFARIENLYFGAADAKGGNRRGIRGG